MSNTSTFEDLFNTGLEGPVMASGVRDDDSPYRNATEWDKGYQK